MSWTETKKINSNMFKPLDDLITEKTNISVQHITFSFDGNSITKDATIDEVDMSKSVIIPTTTGTPVYNITGGYRFGTLSYYFTSSTNVRCECNVPATFSASAMVITFGATVEGGINKCH